MGRLITDFSVGVFPPCVVSERRQEVQTMCRQAKEIATRLFLDNREIKVTKNTHHPSPLLTVSFVLYPPACLGSSIAHSDPFCA